MGTISCVPPGPVKRVNISDSTYRNYSDVPHSVKLFLLWELNWLSKCKYVGTEFRSSWERREEIMMLLLSNCRLSIVRLTPPLPDRLRKHNVNMKLVINALISTPSLCDSQCENNLARGSKHYIPPSLPPSLPYLSWRCWLKSPGRKQRLSPGWGCRWGTGCLPRSEVRNRQNRRKYKQQLYRYRQLV